MGIVTFITTATYVFDKQVRHTREEARLFESRKACLRGKMCLSKEVNCRRREAPVLVTGGPFKKRSATCEKREAYLRRGAPLVKREAYLRRGALLVKERHI